jgi:predicted Zn-dependent peptidase
MESTTSRMMWLGEHLLTHGRVIPPEETVAALNAVTAPAIQRLAREVMDRRRLSLAVVSPKLKDKVQAQASALASGY